MVVAMKKTELINMSEQFVKESPKNYISKDDALNHDYIGMQIYQDPIFAFGTANDDLYELYKSPDIIGSHFLPPHEWLPSANTVISIFFPYSIDIKSANSKIEDWPAEQWLHGRYEGQIFIKEFVEYVNKTITTAGYECIAPAYDARYETGDTRDPSKSPKNRFTSNWSERHIAYACGLGTFGMSAGIITKKGTCGRLCSIVTNIDFEKDTREYTEIYEYCTMCGKCAKNCILGAISKDGKEESLCSDFLDKVFSKHTPRYGCGKCQVNVPCESKIPKKGFN